jgi:hypothetical protein
MGNHGPYSDSFPPSPLDRGNGADLLGAQNSVSVHSTPCHNLVTNDSIAGTTF